MTARIPVSVYLITLNEEQHLRRLLPQLADFAEIVVVDSGSTDQTQIIAQQFSNVRFFTHAWRGFGIQKSFALSLCSNEWVLNLDADEELTPAYLNELRECVTENLFDALETRRKLLRWGRKPLSFEKDDVLIRLFRKSCGRYTDVKVHERILVSGRVRKSSVYFLHHENLSFSQRMHKANQYSQLKAEDKFAAGKSCSILHLLLVFPMAFLKCYLFKGCVFDGTEGLLTSMNHAWYSFMKYAKLWELKQRSRTSQQSSFSKPGVLAAQK